MTAPADSSRNQETFREKRWPNPVLDGALSSSPQLDQSSIAAPSNAGILSTHL